MCEGPPVVSPRLCVCRGREFVIDEEDITQIAEMSGKLKNTVEVVLNYM